MKSTLRATLIAAVFVTVGSLHTNSALAQQDQAEAAGEKAPRSWYYGGATEAKPKSIAQQKAEARAAARMARLESARWYGFHHNRPTATGMAFTSTYSPSWQMPGARPFGWYTGYRSPVVILRR